MKGTLLISVKSFSDVTKRSSRILNSILYNIYFHLSSQSGETNYILTFIFNYVTKYLAGNIMGDLFVPVPLLYAFCQLVFVSIILKTHSSTEYCREHKFREVFTTLNSSFLLFTK